MLGLIHPIKYSLKLTSRNPFQFISELNEDVIKDASASKYESNHHLVWCAGLPKSGTTLIEKILNCLPYVQMNMSAIRRYSEKNISHPHGICHEMFKFAPKLKYSFLKTHTHFDQDYLKIIEIYNASTIISLRDIRDMMISNYTYIINK